MLDFGTVSYAQLCERRETLLYFTLSCVNVGRRYCILRSVV